MNLSSSCGVAGSSLRSLTKILDCCLSKKFGPCLSSNGTVHTFISVTDRCLGALLSHQLAILNRTHLPTETIAQSYEPLHVIRYSVCQVRKYLGKTLTSLEGRSSYCYSLVRHDKQALLQHHCYLLKPNTRDWIL